MDCGAEWKLFYDLRFGVQELCLGAYHSSYEGAPTDGSPWGRGAEILRGGHYRTWAGDCRSATRVRGAGYDLGAGFRLVLAPN